MSTDTTSLPILPEDGKDKTTVGNYFVSNYPPFSFWRPDQVGLLDEVLAGPPAHAVQLGLYVHIPFCRKRCDFCYFRVYTDKNSSDIRRYLDAVIAELDAYAEQPYISGRPLRYVYFGGGTPSYLSVEQLQYLFGELQARMPWDQAEEITFECEPGTLQEKKIRALREMGVTRLSLGVENFDPHILEINNRAHRAKEIDRAYSIAKEVGYPQINIDLIAGMVGETEENWKHCIERAIEMQPESITIYQMEIPYNTTIYQRMQDESRDVAPVADWSTKRRWVDEAYRELEAHGYRVGSAYTAVRGDDVKFVYRDALWTGADMLGTGVASFSHLGGVHFQNEHNFDPYVERALAGERPVHRALRLTDEEKLIREFVLQLKLGSVPTAYFQEKFGVDVKDRFKPALEQHARDGFLHVRNGTIELTRDGLLQVDRLLHDFFLDQHRHARYA
ncbi:MAG: coproporphyrinogen-III oxidase family protein [Planctomycetota bacterium]|jgi:oxygen-independent coproporphyrinogen-3 oxidase